MLSLGPVATARGSDLVANRMLSVWRIVAALGSDVESAALPSLFTHENESASVSYLLFTILDLR
jgi:hypothetical protein